MKKILTGLAIIGLAGAAFFTYPKQTKLSDKYLVTKYRNGETSMHEFQLYSIKKDGINYSSMTPTDSIYDTNGDGFVDIVAAYEAKPLWTSAKVNIVPQNPLESSIEFNHSNNMTLHKRENSTNLALFLKADKKLNKFNKKVSTMKPDIEYPDIKQWGAAYEAY